MFPAPAKYDFRQIGVWSFLVGVACKIVGTLAPWFVFAAAAKSSETLSTGAYVAWQVTEALGDPLMYNGVVLYLLGRVMRSWSVSLIGFEHANGDTLLLRGPDGAQTVWIGRKYSSVLEAEAAAEALRRRHGGVKA